MKDILYQAQHGADLAGDSIETTDIITASADDQLLTDMRIILLSDRFPKVRLELEQAGPLTQSEEKVTTQIRPISLASEQGFSLVYMLAAYEPMVYLARHHGQKAQMGMLSANYDPAGLSDRQASFNRLPTIKFIPLETAYPLNGSLLPDARMGTMLAGAASAERAGVGSEAGNPAKDFEHKATILGALSVANPSIASSHANHAVRAESSIATGLSNGKLGNLYVPNGLSEFPGYGEPVTLGQADAGEAVIYIPDSFLDDGTNAAFGVSYDDASRSMLGAGMKALYERQPPAQRQSLGSQIMSLSAEVKSLP